MIVKCEIIQNHLKWHNENGNVNASELNVSKFIFDDNNILGISPAEDVVWVLDENGKCCCELKNSDDLYIMYIQKHPRYGLCVVASVKNEAEEWKDSYLTYNDMNFEIISNAR